MRSDIIKLATNRNYTKFSNAIKQELRKKLAKHEIIRNYTKEYDKISILKQKFSEINGMAEG